LLENFSIESLVNLTTLTIENCPTVDWISIITNAPKLRNFRMTGVDWNLPDTSLLERIYNMSDPDGVGNSQLTGKVHVPVIKTSELAKYRSRWKDLEITYNTEREEFIVKYFNPDGSEWKELETAVAVGDVVPVPDFIPTQEATEQYVYEFAYWKIKDTDIRYDFTSPLGDNLYLEAVYNAITRTYTIVYESKGVVLQTNENVKYGEYIDYLGETPTYTTEEVSNRFYLFSGWDKSGYVNGDKVISAQYSVFQYSTNFFKEHTLSELTPV
jgi:hypothetical protein